MGIQLKKYQLLIERGLEKVPFIGYLNRLKFFLLNPTIDGTYGHIQQKEHSFLDLFNGLGVLTVIVALIILYDRSFNEFKIILAFNPLFVVMSWVTNAIVFSSVSSLLFTFIFRISKSPRKYNSNLNFYNLFTHGLRCYAVFGLFLGLPFIKICGSLYLELIPMEEALSAWYWQIYILVTLVGGFLWLVFYPFYQYCKIFKIKTFNIITIFLIFGLSSCSLKFIPLDYSEKFLDKDVSCELFKKGRFINNLPQGKRKEAINLGCS